MILELPLFHTKPTFSMLLLNDQGKLLPWCVSESSDKLFTCFIEFCLFKNCTGVDSSVHTNERYPKARETVKATEKQMATDPTLFTNCQINKSTNTWGILNKLQEHSWILHSNMQIKMRKSWTSNIQKCSVQNPIEVVQILAFCFN